MKLRAIHIIPVVLVVGLAGFLYNKLTADKQLNRARQEITAAILFEAEQRDPSGESVGMVRRVIKRREEYYVAPQGSESGEGSRESPWSLEFALSHPPYIRPGDVIWLRGGEYRGSFVSNLTGTREGPIVVRQYPGERATLEGEGERGSTLTINGGYAWYWGFEVTNSDERRVAEMPGSFPEDLPRGAGVSVYGGDTKVINLVVHDASGGIESWAGATRSELSGNIIYYNGWDGPGRAHGHGIYVQNERGTKPILGNVVFSQFRDGIHAYSEEAALSGIYLDKNIVFMNGYLSERSPPARNILLGGHQVADSPLVFGNLTYFPQSAEGGENNLGYEAGCSDARILENYFVGPTALKTVNCQASEMQKNYFVGGTVGFQGDDFPENHYYDSPPEDVVWFVHRDKWEVDRSLIVIYNWPRQESVSVDFTDFGLAKGDAYRLRNVQDFFDDVAYGVAGDEPITISMVGRTVAKPVGTPPPPSTFPEFGVFVMDRIQEIPEEARTDTASLNVH